MPVSRRTFTTLAASLLGGALARAQSPQDANYDESRVGAYTLPPLLTRADGRPVRTAAEWRERRAELLEAYAAHVYGRTPAGLPAFKAVDVEAPVAVLDGRAWRQQVRLEWGSGVSADVLVFRPRTDRAVPVFIGLNYFGNHAVHPDPAIVLSTRWMRSSDANFIVDHRATERSRGTTTRRWPLDLIIAQGCAVMTAYYGDFAPDDPSVVGNGMARLATSSLTGTPAAQRWGAIGMWAWGLSQMRLAAATLPGLDPTRAAVIGHSRLGKAALWAGVQDEQFAMVVANDSGEMGAALARRTYGETLKRITTSFPHWFCTGLSSYGDRVHDLPVDQHQLLALVAPRVLHVASAVDDRWADPRGEFLATMEADAVWRLHGVPGLGTTTMPPVGPAIGRRVRYHIREGGHDIIAPDWTQYLATAKQELT
ncbi:MAG TPA: hypothetical protein VMF13_13460 [Luteitalea sp.]|nr:hypothetical protein [Luteitalea sp.]